MRVGVPFAKSDMSGGVVKVVMVVNKEILILKRERVSANRKVELVMKSVLNELRDEVDVVRREGRFRRGRFAHAFKVSREKFLGVNERLNEVDLSVDEKIMSFSNTMGFEKSKLSHGGDLRLREYARIFKMLNEEISEFKELIVLGG